MWERRADNHGIKTMEKAIDAIKSGKCGYLSASRKYGVPKSTLERCKEKNKTVCGSSKGLGSKQPTFTQEQEIELVKYVKTMDGMLHRLTTSSGLQSLTYQFAKSNNIKNTFNHITKQADWDWLRSFMNRHNLSLRSPKATSAGRAWDFNRRAVSALFDILEEHNRRQ